MSNFLTSALSGLAGAVSGSGLLGDLGGGSTLASVALKAVGASVPSRDSQISDLGDISSSVNLLGQLANAVIPGLADNSSSSTDADSLLSLPPSPPMPAPAKPADVPTDDHGQSNIVFSDGGADGSLIH